MASGLLLNGFFCANYLEMPVPDDMCESVRETLIPLILWNDKGKKWWFG